MITKLAPRSRPRLAQVFGRSFHSAMLDAERQSFFRRALEAVQRSAGPSFVVVLGVGSVLPMLRAARSFQGVLLESSQKLADLATDLLKSNQLTNFKVAPGEIRSDRLKDFDIRPFNALRHTSSNSKADFWWWPVRTWAGDGWGKAKHGEAGLDNQQNTQCSLLGKSTALCGFDFQRSNEIALDEVRRPLKLQATQRGRCNCAVLWWVAKFQDLEYSTRPALADGKTATGVYQRALKAAIKQQSAKLGRRVRVLDAGCGIGLLGLKLGKELSAALEGAEVWLCEAVPLMRHVCREVVAANSGLVAEKRGPVAVDVPKFDIVVSEVMDLWCLGEGIIPTMRHAHQKLLAEGGVLLPGRLRIYVQPLELSLWSEVEETHSVTLRDLGQRFRSKFSAVRIEQFPHRFLTKDWGLRAEPILALEIDLANLPSAPAEGEANIEGGVKLCIRMGKKPALRAKVVASKIDHRGMLSGYGLWWSAELGPGHEVTSCPSSPQRSWKQLIRWLDEPRFVEENEEIQVQLKQQLMCN
eukprot:Skav235786  [mRNA]  locus=scaffold7679:15655:28420:- [translate_table: standard]